MLRRSKIAIPKYHWKRELPDPRDHLYSPSPAVSAAAPTTVDLRSWCSPIEDQGQLGSCTGNAIAGIIEYLDRKNNKQLTVSRLFIYYQERLMEGTMNYDSGAMIRDGIKSVNTYGAPLESIWPYVINRFTIRPSQAAYTDAAKRKAGAYQKCANFTAVKTAIAQGYPVVVGFDVYDSFESTATANTGIMTYPNTKTESLLGGHAVSLVGYYDNFRGTGNGMFIARNSWGTSWGDHGYFYMPYQVIQDTNMSSDFWFITSVTNP